MDAADVSVEDGVMIAFLPANAEWSMLELPHMTLVYAGSKSKLGADDFSSLVKDAAGLALLTSPFSLMSFGIATFGEGTDQVKVLRLRATPELMSSRRFVERWNQSEPPFSPHVTIGPVTDYAGELPRSVFFNKLVVAWGQEVVAFGLGTSY